MKNEGWTLSDLAGELLANGFNIEDFDSGEIQAVLNEERPEVAAEKLIEPDQ